MPISKNNSKIIFHIDMNAFFCSVACILNPTLRGKAFAIGRENTIKGVISTASYEARKLGIHSAMSLKEAYDLAPKLIVVNLDYNIYLNYHYKFVTLVKQYTKLLEIGSIDEVYADMTEASLTKHPLVLAKEIQVRLLEELKLPCSIGIGPTLFLAKMASDMKKPLGITVIRKREVDKILYPLSVSEIYGVGKKTFPILIDNGIKTIGDFMNPINKDKILYLIGENQYNYVVASVLGNTSNIIDPERRADSASISTSSTYDVPLFSEAEILLELRNQTRQIVNKMKSQNYYTKSINITLRDTNFKTITRSKALNEYTDDFIDIFEVVTTLLEENIDDKSYRLIGVGLGSLVLKDNLPKEYNLFTLGTYEEKYENILNLMSNYQNKYGENSLFFNKNRVEKNKLAKK